MSTVLSISARRRYGLARVCRVWGVARAGIYRWRRAANRPEPPRLRPEPQRAMPDAALVGEIRAVLAASPFHGEGYRKAPPRACCARSLRASDRSSADALWARLRHAGVRISKNACAA